VRGASRDASPAEIKAAWRIATDKFEPGSGSGQFRMFNEAADVLLDPERREAYDASLEGDQARVQPAGDLKDGVAHLFGIQARAVHMREDAISCIHRRMSVGALAIDRAGDQQPMQRLHAPALVHQFRGQPVEQGWVQRRGAVSAKVEHPGHERLSEVAQPDVVHRHPCRQRIVPMSDPAGKRQASARAGRWGQRQRGAVEPRGGAHDG
jgi:curved DNA-binding protein CbpA